MVRSGAPGRVERPADCKPAIQPLRNLRYEGSRWNLRPLTRLSAAVWLATVVQASDPAPEYLSPLALVAGAPGHTLYVALETGRRVALFEPETGTVHSSIALPDPPTGLALSADGSKLYVTGGSPQGKVHVIDLPGGTLRAALSTGHTPMAPVLSADGHTLYVCNRFHNDVSLFDLATGRETARVPVLREPVAAVLSADGKHLFVANHLPAVPSDANHVAAAVSVLNTDTRAVVAQIVLADGANSLQGLALSPDGRFLYVTHLLARYTLPTTQIERGWIMTDALAVIDATRLSLVNTVLLDDVHRGAANPWGVACTADGRWLCVSHAGTHELSVIDRVGLHEKLDRVAAGQRVSDVSASAADVPNDLSFLTGLRRRVPFAGHGPRGLAMVGSRAYVAEYFSDSLGVVELGAEATPLPQSLALGPQPVPTQVRRGEMLFHDARSCFQMWLSCASCHPGGGRADGLNWDLLLDGVGNAKNTKSLLLAHQTPPTTATGSRPHAEASVRAGFRFIQFSAPPEENAQAIDAYLKSLQPLPSPYLVHGELSAAGQRGQKLFQQAGCATCHRPPLYTNLKRYEVGTGRHGEAGLAFDTPTLVEVWRSAPYLHDGRALTIQEVLTKYNQGDAHGDTSGLTPAEIEDLAEFILSL